MLASPAAMRLPRANTKGVRAFFLLCALPYFFVFPYLGAVNNPNENVRTYMTMAIVEHGTFQVDDVVARFGWVNDMSRVPKPDGTLKYYSLKGPANSYAGVPFYWAFRAAAKPFGLRYPSLTSTPAERADWMRAVTWTLRLFTVQLPCFAFLVWLERYLRGFSPDAAIRLTAVAAVGLGTNFLAYTHMFASHSLFAVAAFMSFGLIERELHRTRGDAAARSAGAAFWAGTFAGLVTSLEYHGFPVSGLLALFGLFVFYRPAKLAAFAAGGLLQAGLVAFFQWRAFGDPLTPGHKLAETQAFASVHAKGIFGITAPTWEAFSELSFDRSYGFFGTSPYMWLGLLAVPCGLFLAMPGPRRQATRVRRATLMWVALMAALWLVNAGKIYWRAGWTIGPRHLGAAPPFFALGAVVALEWLSGRSAWRRALARGLGGGLAIASMATIGLIGLLVDTLPETFSRPLLQFTLPMMRGGFVPHHVGEWFGWKSTTGWYLAAGAMILACLLTALAFAREKRLGPYLARVATAGVAASLALHPALTLEPGAPYVGNELRTFMQVWEPKGRDRVSIARVEAERRGPRGPCHWHRLADIERSIGLEAEAIRDAAKASAPRETCKPQPWWAL